MHSTGQTYKEKYTVLLKEKTAQITIYKARLDLNKLEKSLTQGDRKFQIVSLELPTFYYYRNRKR